MAPTAPSPTSMKEKARLVFGDVVDDVDSSLRYSPSPSPPKASPPNMSPIIDDEASESPRAEPSDAAEVNASNTRNSEAQQVRKSTGSSRKLSAGPFEKVIAESSPSEKENTDAELNASSSRHTEDLQIRKSTGSSRKLSAGPFEKIIAESSPSELDDETDAEVITSSSRNKEDLRVRKSTGSSQKHSTGPFEKIIGEPSSSELENTDAELNTSSSRNNEDLQVRKSAGSSRKLSAGPFEKIIAESSSSEKENTESAVNVDMDHLPDAAKIREEVRRGMRNYDRSPVRPDRLRETQDAIRRASRSVKRSLLTNNSLNAARKAKEASLREKTTAAARRRREWTQDATESKEFYDQMNKDRQEVLSLQRHLSKQQSQNKAQQYQEARNRKIRAAEQETEFNSGVFCDHQRRLKQEADEKRRMSIEARSKLRANHRLGDQKMRLASIEEDQVILEERYAASIAKRNTQQQLAEKRRQSFSFRNGDARRIRELHREMEKRRLEEETASFELQQDGERDAVEYKKKLEQDRRNSLAGRNQEAARQRKEEELTRSQAADKEHASYELEFAADRDVDTYKAKLAEQRRESLAGRNLKGRHERELASRERKEFITAEQESFELKRAAEKDAERYRKEMEQLRRESLASRNKKGKQERDLADSQQKEEFRLEQESYELKRAGERDADHYKRTLEIERRESLAGRNRLARQLREQAVLEEKKAQEDSHASYELKWAGEKDAEAYKRQLQKERRESLEGRNKERVQHAKVMGEIEAIAREKEEESFALKWAGENDVKVYLAKLEEERRQSLQERGKQVVQYRAMQAEQRVKELDQQHQDEELRAGDHKEAELYQKECADKERASLEYKRKEARKQRLEDEQQKQQQLQLDSDNFQVDSGAWADVQGYLKDCNDRRRLSLACRAKEKRKHATWEKRRAEEERVERSRNVRDRLIDHRYVELAAQKERARAAIENLKHKACTFNPFSSMMG